MPLTSVFFSEQLMTVVILQIRCPPVPPALLTIQCIHLVSSFQSFRQNAYEEANMKIVVVSSAHKQQVYLPG